MEVDFMKNTIATMLVKVITTRKVADIALSELKEQEYFNAREELYTYHDELLNYLIKEFVNNNITKITLDEISNLSRNIVYATATV